jgi:hypothetical protein
MPREDYWEKRMERRPVRTLVQLGFGILAGCAVLGVAVWGAIVLFSGIKGQGDSVVKHNSSDNFISAQAGFVRDNEEFQADLVKIRDASKQVKDFEATHPTGNGTPYDPAAEQDQNLRTTLTGLTQSCQATAADYNTRSKSYLSQDFKDAGLPERLDPAQCSTAGG